MSAPAAAASASKSQKGDIHDAKDKQKDVRQSNIVAAKAVCDAVRTSLGPKGMDKMIITDSGEVLITNDGATILNQMKITHPAAKMLVDLSKSQDIEAGDGTTTVVVLAGSLLNSCSQLLNRGIHPTMISESWQMACERAVQVLRSVSIPVNLNDRESLIKSATTSLSSKVVSQNSGLLAPVAVDAVLRVIDTNSAVNVDLRDIKVIKKLGGTVDDTKLVDGLVFPRKATHAAGGPGRIENAKIGLIQFCLSAPKTDMDNQVVVNDFQQMDRILKEERKYILELCKKIAKAGCNVLLVQKSILRDAVNDLSLHFLAKLKIMVIRDVERNEIEFISKTLGCTPVAHIDAFTPDKLGAASLVEEVDTSDGKITTITGVQHPGRTVSILVRGSNKLMLDEAERSIHDALCVVRCLVKERYMIAGGGAPEIEVSHQLMQQADSMPGVAGICLKAFAEALEVIPYTLAENAGLHPIEVVTELRARHVQGERTAGINVRKSKITDILEENVLQPLLVHTSAARLATEYVRMILKIDDIVIAR